MPAKSKTIEEIFKENADGQLFGKWTLLKAHFTNELKAVPQQFPHYTKHDASHSEAILAAIANIVAPEYLEQFTTSDLFLLLAAAYGHDIGMAVTADERESALSDPKFLVLVRTIQKSKGHPLKEYADHFEIQPGKLERKSTQVTVGDGEDLKYLLAEHFRRQHHQRSAKHIEGDPKVRETISDEALLEVGEDEWKNFVPVVEGCSSEYEETFVFNTFKHMVSKSFSDIWDRIIHDGVLRSGYYEHDFPMLEEINDGGKR